MRRFVGSSIVLVMGCGSGGGDGGSDATTEAAPIEAGPPVVVDCFGMMCASPNACCLTPEGGTCLDASAVSNCQASFPCIPGLEPQCSFPPPNVMVPTTCTFCASGPVTLDDAGAVSLTFPVESVCDETSGASCPPTCVDLDASCPDAQGTCRSFTLEGKLMPFGLCL